MYGERVKEIREENNLTQSEFGAIIGVNKSGLSKIEKNKVSLSKSVISNITREFCVNEEWLLNGTGMKYNESERVKQDLLEEYIHTSLFINEDFKEFLKYYSTLEITDHMEINTAFWCLADIFKKQGVSDRTEYFEIVASMISDIKRFFDFCDNIPQKLRDSNSIMRIVHKSKHSYESSLLEVLGLFIGNDLISKYNEGVVSNECEIKVIGSVAAGKPIEAVNTADDLVVLSGTSKADFALKIRGDSMEPRIMDGSTVLVAKQEVIETGQIGIFSINGEVTCKRAVLTEGRLELHSFNKKYSPIIISEADREDMDVVVIGRVLLDEE